VKDKEEWMELCEQAAGRSLERASPYSCTKARSTRKQQPFMSYDGIPYVDAQ